MADSGRSNHASADVCAPAVPRDFRGTYGGRWSNKLLILLCLWWAHKGSNLGPLPCEGNALPLSYAPGIFVHDQKPLKIGVGPGNKQCQSPRFTKCGAPVSSCQRAETGMDVVPRLVTAAADPSFYPKRCFVEPDQADASRPVPFAKIFPFAPDPNHF